MFKFLTPKTIKPPFARYSHGVEVPAGKRLVLCSGQLGIRPDDLVPDDPFAYREAWVNAFRERRIYPRHVASLSEDALLWRSPDARLEPIGPLSFRELRFDGDPGA